MPEHPAVPAGRRLVLVRHARAQAEGPDGDAARPLSPAGHRQAGATGAWLCAAGLGDPDPGAPDLALVSSALRAGQTWQELAAAGVDPGTVREEPDLYRNSPQALVHQLAATPAAVRSVLVVAHEPVLSATALALAGPGSDGAAVAQVRVGLGTGRAVVLDLDGPWDDLGARACRLVALGPG